MGKFTTISNDAFDTLQLDAGVVLTSFDPGNPAPPSNDEILATTTGGIEVTCKPTYSDLAEDVDNAQNGLKEYMHLDSWDCSIKFTSLKFNATNTKWALGSADIVNGTGYKKIVPRRNLSQSDFSDIWWVGDKANGGAVAVRLMNAISSNGLSIKTEKNGKGQSEQTISGHPSVENPDEVAMEFFDIDADALKRVKVAAEAQSTLMFGTPVSDIQADDVKISGRKITGTLKYLNEGAPAIDWGAGNFIALKFSDLDPNATSVRVGLDPSQSSGLVDIINDPDKNGIFKITDKTTQKFKIVSSDGTNTTTQTYDLSELVTLTN